MDRKDHKEGTSYYDLDGSNAPEVAPSYSPIPAYQEGEGLQALENDNAKEVVPYDDHTYYPGGEIIEGKPLRP